MNKNKGNVLAIGIMFFLFAMTLYITTYRYNKMSLVKVFAIMLKSCYFWVVLVYILVKHLSR